MLHEGREKRKKQKVRTRHIARWLFLLSAVLMLSGITAFADDADEGNDSMISYAEGVEYYVALDGTWQRIAIRNNVVGKQGKRYYTTPEELEKIYGDFGFKASEFNGDRIFPHTAANDPDHVWADQAPSRDSDGNWKVLLAEKDKMFVYYLPANTEGHLSYFTYSKSLSDQTLLKENMFCSVTISDPDKLTDLKDHYYVRAGEDYSVTLPTKNGYKWKCLDRKTMKEIEPTTTTTSEDGNKVTYTFKNLQYGIKIEPVNPKNNKIKIVYDAATVENNLEKLNQVTAGIQKPDYEGQVQGEGTFTTTISRNEQSYKLLNVDSKRVRVSVPSSSKNKKYWYKFNGWTLGDTALKYNAGDTLSVKELKSYEVNGEITLKATWTGLNTNGRIASCNFYVNRYCEIADNLSNGFSAAPEQDFTKSLYTAGVDEDNNLSLDKNGDLGILAPATEESGAYETDTALRSMVKTPYQGITFDSFPSDEQVLENIRSNYSASNPIKVGDRVVTKEQLTTDNFKVRWYSFKFVHSDGWHVDGILVAKEGKLVVTKTFTGSAKKAIEELKDKFSIDVTHKEKPTTNDPDTEDYKLVIKSKSDAGSGETGYDSYNEKTNTYTWILKARDYQTYNIKEKNYKLDDFNNSSYTYTVRNNDASANLNSTGKDTAKQDLEWQKYSDTDGIQVQAKAYPDDVPSTAYQTVSLRNMYVKANYITIDKIDDFTINGMEDVKFQISSLDEPDTFEVWKNPKANAYNYEEDDSEYGFTQRVEDNTLETDETGLIYIKLKPGAYILKEKSVEGYKAQPQFRIQVDDDGHISDSYPCDDAGNKVTNGDSEVVTSPDSSVISISNTAEELTSVTAKADMHDVKASSVQVELWCNGSKMNGSEYTQTLNKANGWTYTWKNLPLYADGSVANYTLRETKIGDVSYDPGTNTDGFGDYIVTYDKCKYREADSGEFTDPASWTDDNGKRHYAKHALLVVHNENEKPEELFLSVNAKIQWNDNNNQDGIRPDLMDLKIEDADGDQAGNSLELNADNGWAAKFVELNKYKNNHETSYAVTDKCFTSPEGYTAEITGDMVNGFVITLTHKPETTTIEGTKAWSDSGKKNLRPDSITVSLLADGEKVDETTTTADKNWKFRFDNKPVYKDGKKITYTVEEQNPAAYYKVSTSKDDDGNYVITNKYQPESVKEKTRVTTVVTGKNAIEAFKYELTAAEDYGDAVKMPEDNTVTTSDGIQKNQSEDKSFDSIEFTKEGTYTFHVKTLTKATHGGWIYDNEVKTLKIHVVDENGQLRVADADSTTSATMTHSFTPTALEGDTAITIQKSLTGRNMLDGEKFDFTLSVADEATKEAVKDGDINLAETKASASGLKDGETATVSFGRAEFYEAGEYTFQVKETDGGKTGMTYDTEAKTFKVKVTDDDGILKATQESVPTIQNVYKASGSFTPEGTKTLLSGNGNKLSVGENQFKFSVHYVGDEDGEPVVTGTTGSGKDAKINFGTLSYTTESLAKLMEKGYADSVETDEGRAYYIEYVVTEHETGNDAIQKNTESKIFRVIIKDDGAGKLTATVDGDQNLNFENRYVTDTATVSMEGSKVLEGRTLSRGEFSFHITSDDANAPMPKETTVKNDESGNVSFGDITYTKDDLGDAISKTFTYKITESGSQSGVTNDSETKTVKVTVKDDGKGHLTAETDPGAAPLFTFTNKYSAAPTESAVTDSVKVKKVLEGGSLTADQFHFVMKDESGDVVSKASNKADGNINFPALKFTKAGTYNYTISEEAGDSSHVTYDNTVYNVTASVTDDFQGKLHVEWNCGVKSISFHNVYTATPVSVEPKVVKTITGDTPEVKETFRFALSGVSVNSDADTMPPMPEGSEDGAKTIDIEGEGTGYFGPITFEKAGTYRYQVVELTGQNPRYTYDTTTYQLTYVVKDQDGTLKAEAAIESTDGSAESLVFSNQYTRSTVKLEGDAAITVQKQLTGRSMLQGEKFSFTMKPADDQTKTAIEKGDIKIADDTASVEGMHKGETATVSFGSVEFAEEGEYTFQVQEKDGGKAGMTYDTEAKTLKVKVTSENDTLKAVQENVPAFKNRYKAEGNFTPAGTKTLLSAKGNKLNIKDGQFTFEVRYLQDSNGEPVATGTTKSGKDAAIDFGTLSYSTSELKTLIQKGYADEAETDNGAEYYIDYLVTEKDTGNDALQKNSEAQTFRVVLKDDGTGKLTASSEDGKNLKFQNRYVTDTAVVSMDGHKVLNGRPLSDGEFTFLISSDDANAPMPKQTEVKNTTSGSVSFGNITFTKDDLEDADSKTFTYKITESGTQPGVTNDSETKTVKVKVTDDGKGHIKAETESGAAPLFAFTNNYKPVSAESSVSDSLKVKKILKGRDLKEGEFHFVMKDADGKEVATATNKADGIIQFQAQKFTEAGTYNYTIEEVSGDLDRVTYDETVHHVTAVVTDSYDGKPLSVTWNAGETAVEFHNVYTPKSDNPSKPGKDDNGTHGNGGHANGSNGGNSVGNSGSGSQVSSHTPQTGDDENTGFFLGLMGISVAMLAGITGLRKKFALKK